MRSSTDDCTTWRRPNLGAMSNVDSWRTGHVTGWYTGSQGTSAAFGNGRPRTNLETGKRGREPMSGTIGLQLTASQDERGDRPIRTDSLFWRGDFRATMTTIVLCGFSLAEPAA
jgi:hypothetical protein